MKHLSTDLANFADILQNEIINDNSEYFWPVSDDHKIFEQAYMKFVNRNLNYFNFQNMVVSASLEEPEYHQGFPETLNFCKLIRKKFDDESAPFGRMCIWNIPPNKKLLPHVDNFSYHHVITRYIFFISSHEEGKISVCINNEKVLSNKGCLFRFYPGKELHEFVNNSSDPLYFLGFDIWKKNVLEKLIKHININEIKNDTKRLTTYGTEGTSCKYISKH